MKKYMTMLPLIGIAAAGIGCGTMDRQDDAYAGTSGVQAPAEDRLDPQVGPAPPVPRTMEMEGERMQHAEGMHDMQGATHGAMEGGGPDAPFYRTALSSGLAEVEISEYAAQQAAPEVASLAQRIARDHRALNTQLQQASGMAQMPALMPQHENKVDQMKRLVGSQINYAYLDHMAQSHQQSIELYQAASESAQDPRTRQLAQAALPTLREHAQAVAQVRSGLGGP